MNLNKNGHTMRTYPIPKDKTKVHIRLEDKLSRCMLRDSLYKAIRLTTDPTEVTCVRCISLMGK